MNVSCPECTTVFRVDPAKVPERGVRARCSVCGGLIAVRRPSVGVPAVPPLPAPPAAVAPEAPAAPPLPTPKPAPVARPVPDPAVPAAWTTVPEKEAAAPPSPGRAEPVLSSPARPEIPVVAPPPPPPPPPAPIATGPGHFSNPFLQQDPGTRARRLARALVSDLVVYHPDKRQRGLVDGNLKELFAEEIRKSWEEYSEQIGEQVARETNYFTEALNEILAEGRPIFS